MRATLLHSRLIFLNCLGFFFSPIFLFFPHFSFFPGNPVREPQVRPERSGGRGAEGGPEGALAARSARRRLQVPADPARIPPGSRPAPSRREAGAAPWPLVSAVPPRQADSGIPRLRSPLHAAAIAAPGWAQGGVLGGTMGTPPFLRRMEVSGKLGVGRQVFSTHPLSSPLLGGEKCPTAHACAQDYKWYFLGGEGWRSSGGLCCHPMTPLCLPCVAKEWKTCGAAKAVLKYFIYRVDFAATICDFKNLRGFFQQDFLG